MLPMVTIPTPSSPLSDYSALRRQLTLQRTPTRSDSGPKNAPDHTSMNGVGGAGAEAERPASPFWQRRQSNLYRVLPRRTSHSSLQSDQSGPSQSSSFDSRGKHRMSLRGLSLGSGAAPSRATSPEKMLHFRQGRRMSSIAQADAPAMSTSSSRKWLFGRARVPDHQHDDVFHDAISDEPSQVVMTQPRAPTGLTLQRADLWADANSTTPPIPFFDGNATQLRNSPSPTVLFASPARSPVQASSQDLSSNVVLMIEPMHRVLNMFGPLQVTGSYSLGGCVHVSLPHAMDECQSIEVCSLTLRLQGYSVYVDSSGRYSAVRLCDIKHDVGVPHTQLALPPHGASMYGCEYDMFVPGWLPASISTKSVSTFYQLVARAQLRDVRHTAPGASVMDVQSAPTLVVIQRSREVVPIPVAQTAEFVGADVPLPVSPRNPFSRETNPFRRASSQASPLPPPHSPMPRLGAPPKRPRSNRAPLRHYTHAARLHLPTCVTVNGTSHTSLPVKMCLSIPAYSSTHVTSREDQPPLIFGLQVELDPTWQHAKMWSDVRVCEMEAVCVQMEKYSSSLSRSYCTAFALGNDASSFVSPDEIPMFDEMPRHAGIITPQSAICAAAHSKGPPQPYHTALLAHRQHLERTGSQPTERQNMIERFRAYTVGPLPSREKQREKERGREKQEKKPVREERSSTPSRRRTVTNALARLSMFSPSRDSHANEHNRAAQDEPSSTSQGTVENTKASYVFEGDDGFGLALSQKRVRLSFSLPLVPSYASVAHKYDTPQLLPDYESPHMRVRHKLKVKVRFGFGATALASTVGMQSVVMSVPVRFSEAPPLEALSQAPPLVLPKAAQTYVPAESAHGRALPSPYVQASYTMESDAPSRGGSYLPAYAQLFREDGTRVEDDAEVLPAYPDQYARRPSGVAERDSMPVIHLATDAERESKTPAASSLVEALHADDDSDADLLEMRNAVEDDMMEERLDTYDEFDDMARGGRAAALSPELGTPSAEAMQAQPALPMASMSPMPSLGGTNSLIPSAGWSAL